MKKLKEQIMNIMKSEAFRYIVVGGCTTLVNLVVYTFLCKCINVNVDISNVISVVVAILFAYVTNKVFVFQSKCQNKHELFSEFCKFVGARLLTMVIEVGGVYVLYHWIGQDEIIAKLETQVIVLICNFVISKFFVFVSPKEED